MKYGCFAKRGRVANLLRAAPAFFGTVFLLLAACTGGVTGVSSNGLLTFGFTVGGTVSGLSGSGLVLQDNGGDNLGVAADGTFTFLTPVAPGAAYSVSVLVQPQTPSQTCVVSQGTGTIASANVNNVAITCTGKTSATDTIGGTVSGDSGTGLVLQDNGADNLAVGNGAFTFATPLPSGTAYNVTVLSPPINPYQDCIISNGTGTTASSDINNVSVTCSTNSAAKQTIGGTITGITAAGATIVLQDNGRDNLTLSADGTFTFALPIPTGSSYNVTSLSVTGPESVTCVFTNASGIVGAGNVTNVTIACTPNSPAALTPIGVTVSGLINSGLILQDNGGDNLAADENGAYTFPTQLTNGAAYNVTVLTQPPNPAQTCTVTNGAGTVAAGTAVNVTVACVTNLYTIGGSVTGLVGTGLTLSNNGGPTLTVNANGPFVFPASLASGAAFGVAIVTQPVSSPGGPPATTCTVAGGSGTVGAANVTSVIVNCVAPGGIGPIPLNGQNGLLFFAPNYLFVANYGGNQVLAYTEQINATTGLVSGLTLVASITAGVVGPTRLAVDIGNHLYVTNISASTVTVYDLSNAADIAANTIPQITADTISTGIDRPLGITVDENSNVYVANNGSNSISIFAPAAGGGFTQTGTLTQDGAGNPFTIPGVIEYIFNYNGGNPTSVIMVGTGGSPSELLTYNAPLTATSVPIDVLGSNTACATNPSGPTGVALFAPTATTAVVIPTLYLTNYYSSTVFAYPLDTLTGGGAPTCPTPSAASSSSSMVANPEGVAVDGSGNIFVSNSNTSTITVYAPGSALGSAPVYTQH